MLKKSQMWLHSYLWQFGRIQKKMLSFLFSLANSRCIAVDLGTAFSKSSSFNSSSFPTMTENSDSKRLTPSFIAFRFKKQPDVSVTTPYSTEELENVTPHIGQKAINQIDFRPYFGAGYFMYNIDLQDEESKKFSEKIYLNKSISRFDFEDTLALYLNMYAASVSGEKSINTLSVIVPATFTASQREIVSNAIKNSKQKYGGVILDNEATFTYYGVERIRLFSEKPQTVLFIDVGATSIKAYAGRFELIKNTKLPTANVNITKLSYSISNKEGGAFVTSRMVEHFIKKHDLKDLTVAEKRRLFTGCEKLKSAISFSAIHKSSTYVEDIGSHDELNLVMTEDELKSLVDPLNEEIEKVVKDATKNVTFDSVQIIGGCSRLWGVSSFLQEMLNTTINTNLNADETVAFGGGYAMQYHHKNSRLSAIGWSDEYPVLSISVEYDDKKLDICKRGEKCEDKVNLTDLGAELSLVYNQDELPLPVKSTKYVYNFNLKNVSNATLTFRHNPTGINQTEKFLGENSSAITISSYSTLVTSGPSSAVSTILRAIARRRNTANARMQLEQLTHRILDEIENNQTVKDHMSPTQLIQVTNAATKMKAWINEHADSIHNETQFTVPYKELLSYVQPVWTRIDERKRLENFDKLMQSTLKNVMMTAFVDWPVNKTWLPKKEVEAFNDKLNETMMFAMRLTQVIKETPLYEDCNITSNEVRQKALSLLEDFQRLERIPKPTPVPTPVPTEKPSLFSKVKSFLGMGDENVKVVDPADSKTSKSTPSPTPPPSTPSPTPETTPAAASSEPTPAATPAPTAEPTTQTEKNAEL